MPLYRYLGGPMARVLPVPMMNILNGGAHASNNVDAQEFMVVPIGADTFAEALRMGVEIFHALKKVLGKMGLSTAVGDEGGFAPQLPSNEAALDVLMEAIAEARATSRARTWRSRSTWRRRSSTRTASTSSRRATAAAGPRRRWSSCTPAGWSAIRSCRSRTGWPRTTGPAGRCSPSGCGDRVQLVGDDLFVTNVDRLGRGIEEDIGNAVLVKVNQIGTLTETLQCIEMAKGSAYGVGHLASLGRDRGHLHRRPRGGHRRRADQDRVARAAPTGWPSTTSCCGSPRSWATWRTTRDGTSTRCDPRARAALVALALALFFAVQGGEYSTWDLIQLRREEQLERSKVARAAVDGGLAHARRGRRRARPAGTGAGRARAVRDDPARGISLSDRARGQRTPGGDARVLPLLGPGLVFPPGPGQGSSAG